MTLTFEVGTWVLHATRHPYETYAILYVKRKTKLQPGHEKIEGQTHGRTLQLRREYKCMLGSTGKAESG